MKTIMDKNEKIKEYDEKLAKLNEQKAKIEKQIADITKKRSLLQKEVDAENYAQLMSLGVPIEDLMQFAKEKAKNSTDTDGVTTNV